MVGADVSCTVVLRARAKEGRDAHAFKAGCFWRCVLLCLESTSGIDAQSVVDDERARKGEIGGESAKEDDELWESVMTEGMRAECRGRAARGDVVAVEGKKIGSTSSLSGTI